jgi:hypothetical protein
MQKKINVKDVNSIKTYSPSSNRGDFENAQSNMRESIERHGVIRALLTVGKDLYAVVEETDLDDRTAELYPNGKIMGYPKADIENAVLPEVLIPVDRSAKSLDILPIEMIGMQVQVVFGGRGKYPKYVILQDSISGTRGEPFNIETAHIYGARNAGRGDLESPEAQATLRGLGYSNDEISALQGMKLNDVNWKGQLINFSKDSPTPWTTHQSEHKFYQNLSQDAAGLIKNPPAGKLKRKNCYLPPKAFTGK